MKTKSMYQDELLEIYSEKPNFGNLKDATHSKKLKNMGCKDEFTIQLKVKNEKILDAKFKGFGCVISTVSASLLTEKLKGMKLKEIKKLNKSDMDKFLGIKIIPTRAKCELLALEATKQALK